MPVNRSSIQTIFLKQMILIVLVAVGLWLLIWTQAEYASFKKESQILRVQYLQSQKRLLKQEVIGTVMYVMDMKKQSEKELKESLKEHVYQAHGIAMNLYQQNVDKKSIPEIKKIIKDALRPVRFNDGRGYYFASDMDGIEQLYPVHPGIEGTSVIDLQDSRGTFAIREEIEIIKKKTEGFVTHYWPKPGEDTPLSYPKISFIKYFKPLEWYLGTGEYLDDAKQNIQKTVLNRLVLLRFGTEGYFFGSTYEGAPLFSNGKITIGSNSIRDLTDPNGIKIIQVQNEKVRTSGGGFIRYAWRKLNESDPSPKISFVQGIDAWGWVIGAGIYLDSIEKTITDKRSTLIEGLKKRILRSVVIMVLLLCLVYLWFRRISTKIQKSIDTFSSFLNQSSIDATQIDPEAIAFDEFRDIAISTNRMLDDRKKAETALRESEELFSLFMDHLPACVFIKGENYHTLFVNKYMDKILGAKDWIGKTPFGLFPEDIAQKMITDDKTALNKGYLRTVETIPCRDGQHRVFETHKFKIYRSGKPALLGGVAIDITKGKLAEYEKLKAQKIASEKGKHALVGQVAGKMAHDFNNILGIIMGNTELAAVDCKDPGTIATLNLILEQTIRGKNLTRNLIAFARDHEPKQTFFRLSEKIDLVLNLMRKDLEGIEVLKESKPGTPEILADPGMMEHALVNLFQNAIHAVSTAENPVIHVRTYVCDDCICFEMEDNGCGIPKAHLDDIFDPSFSLKGSKDLMGSYKTGIKGTGYGMSNVKKYIEQHKGSISVDSSQEKGTRFLIRLPVTKKELTAGEIKEIQKEKYHFKKYILLVEDETAISNVQYRILTQKPCNHKVDIANNGKVAMDLFERNNYDFISLDYALPGEINGRNLYNHFRKHNTTIPILFISGNIEFLESIKELKQEDPWVDHLSKPCQNLDYLDSINGLLAL